VLVARTANGFQAPLLAKSIENDIRQGVQANLLPFQYIIFSCTLATIAGALLIPTFQRVLSGAVISFSEHKSVPRLLLHAFSKNGIAYLKDRLAVPAKSHIRTISQPEQVPWKIFILNTVAVAIVTTGVLSAVYASYLTPAYRTTASNLSAVINGFATILLFTFIDPHLSAMTDDVMLGKCSEAVFRKYIVYMTVARLAGTLLAQLLFLPAAQFIAFIAARL
jgi:hypothetical protein